MQQQELEICSMNSHGCAFNYFAKQHININQMNQFLNSPFSVIFRNDNGNFLCSFFIVFIFLQFLSFRLRLVAMICQRMGPCGITSGLCIIPVSCQSNSFPHSPLYLYFLPYFIISKFHVSSITFFSLPLKKQLIYISVDC